MYSWHRRMRKEQAIFYLSRLIKGQDKNDTNIEKMCLCLYFTAVKLRHYLLPRSCEGRFDPTHVIDTISQRSDWKMGFCLVRVFIQLFTTTIGQRTGVSRIFDKSSLFLRQAVARSGWWRSCVWPQLHGKCISMAPVRKVAREQVLLSLNGLVSHHSYRLHFPCTNNVAEYEALLIGLELAAAMGMRSIHVKKGDSQLVVRQVIAEYEVIYAKQQP